MPLEAQCAAAEREAKMQSTPIFGLKGAAYDRDGGGDVVPGPLVWYQPDASYSSSLAGTGKPELLHVMKTMGEQASGHLAVYIRTGGAHGAGDAKSAAPTQSPKKEKKKQLRVSFKCSQSVEAAKAKRGHGGVRKEKTLDAATAPPRKRRKALLPAHDCGAGFVVALRHKKSRASKCTICGVMVRYSHAAPPDLLPHPAGKVNGACPWAATHSNNAGEHVVRSGFRVAHATTLHTNHWTRPQSLAARCRLMHGPAKPPPPAPAAARGRPRRGSIGGGWRVIRARTLYAALVCEVLAYIRSEETLVLAIRLPSSSYAPSARPHCRQSRPVDISQRF